MNEKLHGIIAPISTPFIDDEIAFDHLRENIKRYSRTKLAGLFVLGSNGENATLDESERLKVFETIMDTRSPKMAIVTGVGFESTKLAIKFANRLVEMGTDYISVLTPSYYKKSITDDALVYHYTKIADEVGVPILIYNAPGHTGITLSVKAVERLAQHPNIVAMKDVAPGMFPHYLQYTNDHFNIISGTIDSFLPALMIGAIGGVVSLADPFPEACCELYRLFKAGNYDDSRALYKRLLHLNQSVSGAFGVAGVKAAMDFNGFFGGNPRAPILPLTSLQREKLSQAIQESGILQYSLP